MDQMINQDLSVPSSSSATPLRLSEQEEHLVVSFRCLNEEGREKAVERIDELLDVPKYQNEVCDAYINANRFADKIKREHEKKEDRAPAKYTI